jgi:hypothetical protein
MARTALTPIVKPLPNAQPATTTTMTYTAVDVANGNSVPATGSETLYIKNTGGSTFTVTVHSVVDPWGRAGDDVFSIAAGVEVVTRKYPVQGWQQADGTLWIDAANVAVQIAVVKDPVF